MSFSEKYQNFLDKVNDRIPIKFITKPLDKIHPLLSFFVFLIAIIVILMLVVKPFSFTSEPEYNTVTIKLANNNGELLKNFEFSLRNLTTGEETEYATDTSGKRKLDLDKFGDYEFVVEKKGYKLKILNLDPTVLDHKIILDVFELPNSQTKVLTFVDKNTKEKIEEDMQVTIRCDDVTEVVQPQQTSVSGEYEFEIPNNCNELVLNALGETYSSNNVIVEDNQSVVEIDPRSVNVEYGHVKILVKSGNNYLDNITVRLYTEDDLVNPVTTGETSFGSIRFKDLEVGNYKAVTYDSQGTYLSNETSFTIKNNQQVSETINVSATDNGSQQDGDEVDTTVDTKTILVILKDLETGSEIAIDTNSNPMVSLLVDGNQTVDLKAYTQNGIEFIIEEGKDYSLTAQVENYINASKTVSDNVDQYIMYLEAITEDNVSNIQTTVLDEDNLPVENATIWIYDAVDDYIDPRFSPQRTDENGSVVFEEIPLGNFYLKLRKVYLEGQSTSFNHTPPEDSDVNLPVVIGEGSININVKNNIDDIIGDASIEIYTENGILVGSDFTNSSGYYSKDLKADKKVYLKISKENHLSYYTELIPIYKNQSITKDIVLLREYNEVVPKVELLGVFDAGNTNVNYLMQNNIYEFRFRVTSPQNSSMGFKFNIGVQDDAANDIVYIKPVVANFGTVTYYDKYPFTNTVNEDVASKQIDVFWSNVGNATYELTVPVQVVNAQQNQAVPIKYWTYKNTHNSEEFQKIYYIGVENICGEDNFCISGQYVDLVKDIRYDISNDPIPATINNDYRLNYTITNAGSSVYNDARFDIKNIDLSTNLQTDVLDIVDYTISGVFNGSDMSTGEHNFKIPFSQDYLESPKINVYDNIEIESVIRPLYLGNTKLKHTIIGNQTEIYDGLIEFVVSKQHAMDVDYTPKNIVPGTPFNFTITATDDDGYPIQNALVNVFSMLNGHKNTVTSGAYYTNDQGFVNVYIPALYLGEILILEVQKSGYFSEPIEIEIKQDILDVLKNNNLVTSNSPIEININRNDITGTIESVTLLNKTNYDLKLNDFLDRDFTFNYANLINVAQTQTYLNSQVANDLFVIEANEEKNLDIKMSPSTDALDLVETTEIVGNIKGSVSKTDSDVKYYFDIPIESKISVGQGVYENECLIVQGTPGTWTTVVDGSGVQTLNFTIINNCKDKDNPELFLPLKNIRAKIQQDEDRYGYYDLTIDNKQIRLAEGAYKTVVEEIEPERIYNAQLRYNALNTQFGNVKTKIFINGQIQTDEKIEYVNSATEIALETDLSILKIEDCFDFYDEDKKINNVFDIETEIVKTVGSKPLKIVNNCSDKSKFKITLCDGKTSVACQDLKYENMTGVFENELEFNMGDSEQTIEVVKPLIPGAYRIPAKIEAKNNNNRTTATVIKKLKVNVHDLLYMDDPFIEVEQSDEGTYLSMPVNLYNKDTNMTPWDYATQKVDGDENGFSQYIVGDFTAIYDRDGSIVDREYITDTNDLAHNFDNKFEHMLFNEPDKLEFVDFSKGNDMALITAIGTGAGLALMFVNPLIGISVFFGAIFMNLIIGSFSNDYDQENIFQTIDIPLDYTLPNQETIKRVFVNDLEAQSEDVSVFDMTGSRYMVYLKSIVTAKGKLFDDESIKLSFPRCKGEEHKFVSDEYHTIIQRSNCDSSFNKFEEKEDSYDYSVKCNGSWPRNKIKLEYHTYSVCSFDETLWPQQAGIKPLLFEIPSNTDAQSVLSQGDNIYKIIEFNPTLDDDVFDPAFENARPIGKYRFELHNKEYLQDFDVDLNIYDCFTDSGKIGKTGEGAVPKVNLDWSWNDLDTIGRCENNYCDATQLTQEILTRLDQSRDLLEENSVLCPYSAQQVNDEAMDGSYKYDAEIDGIEYDVPVTKAGIEYVDLKTENNSLVVKVSLINRSTMQQNGTLSIGLDNEVIKATRIFEPITKQWMDLELNQSGQVQTPISIPYGSDNTTEMIYVFAEGIEVTDGMLNILYQGTSVDPNTNNYSTEITLGVHNKGDTDSCQVIPTTMQLRGVDYVDYWFNQDQYPSNVRDGGAWSNNDINTLKQTLSFNAYLTTDNYNDSFISAFDKAYGGKASKLDGSGLGPHTFSTIAPVRFSDETEGYLSEVLKQRLNFILKYSNDPENGVEVMTPGLYNVRIDLIFDNENWKFVDTQDNVDLDVIVTMTYLEGARENSAFYRLPFNGFTGLESSGYNRQNYGVTYLGDEVLINTIGSSEIPIKTGYDNGSNPIRYINVTKESDFYKLNSEVESRGNLLTISESVDNQIDFVFAPSIATPILMNVTRNTLDGFSIYYQLKDNSNSEILYGGNSLLVWNGVGNYSDFSGDSVISKFSNYYDRMATTEDRVNNSYAIDWSTVARRGNVNLRSIVYTPTNRDNTTKTYKLTSKLRGSNPGINFLVGNNLDSSVTIGGSGSAVTKISDIFDLVRDGKICVTNSDDGRRSEFWWNPASIYKENPVFEGDFTNYSDLEGIN